METSLPVVVATISQSLATFIKQELAGTRITVQLLTNPELFFKRLKSIKPELILLDASYPTGEKSASLVKTLQQELAWQDIPLVVIKTFFEPLDESFPEINQENILTQPFSRADLLTVLQRLIPGAINNQQHDQGKPMTEASEKPQEAKEPNRESDQEEGIIELTDMVEPGIPLAQLPSTDDQDSTIQEPAPAPENPVDSERDNDIHFPSDAAIDELTFAANEEVETETDLPVPGSKQTIDPVMKEIGGEAIEETPATDSMTGKPSEDFAAESPDDYLVPDEEELVKSTESESLPPPPSTTATPPAAESETAQPSVISETEAPDFSRQIEALTQEWSKKMLVSTYASMDKLIQALGDMAPTIVEQVAREIIPPLAEKIIKSEIQRLEEKIEDDHK